MKRDREEAALDQMLRHQVLASPVNPAPDVPAADVFAHLRAHHDEQLKAKRRGA